MEDTYKEENGVYYASLNNIDGDLYNEDQLPTTKEQRSWDCGDELG